MNPPSVQVLVAGHVTDPGIAVGEIDVEWNMTLVADNHFDRLTPYMREPVSELADVGQRCGEAEDVHCGGKVDQHLLPYRAALDVIEEVDLIDDHVAEVLQTLAGQEHVAKDLGGHDA